MKTLLIIMVSLTVSLGAVAQRGGHHVGGYHGGYHSRIYVSPYRYSFGFGYPFYGYGYYGSPYYGYPYGYGNPYYGSGRMPYKLSLEIQSIKTDYKNQIRDTRKNKSLGHSERRQQIRSLKAERDQEIISAQRNFIRRGRTNSQNPANSNSSGSGS